VRALIAAGIVAALMTAASPADASTHVRYGIQDDAWLEYGPGTLAQRLAKIDSLGVPLVRFTLHWDVIAPRRPAHPTSPADPAYDWRLSDAVLNGLRAHGLTPVVTLLGTPPWANGGRAANYAPTRAADFGRFVRAAARRYSWVRYWLVWNEPNQQRWLRPSSPKIYVQRLLNPAYAVIHSQIPGAKVGGGVTAPRAGTGGVAPVTWILAMGAAGAHLDAYAHHPYPSSPAETPFSGGCERCLTITMATLQRLVTTVTRVFGPKRIWLTEYGYQTKPPDPFGVSLAKQAAFIGQAALRAYEAPRVDMLIQYLYRDEPTLARFQSGLLFLNNRVKPSLRAFELPFAEKSRDGSRVVVWGQIRDGAGARPYRIEVYRDGGWLPLGGTALTGAAGFFARSVAAPPGTLLRVWSLRESFASLPLRVA
jgi:hypothetical protein